MEEVNKWSVKLGKSKEHQPSNLLILQEKKKIPSFLTIILENIQKLGMLVYNYLFLGRDSWF